MATMSLFFSQRVDNINLTYRVHRSPPAIEPYTYQLEARGHLVKEQQKKKTSAEIQVKKLCLLTCKRLQLKRQSISKLLPECKY